MPVKREPCMCPNRFDILPIGVWYFGAFVIYVLWDYWMKIVASSLPKFIAFISIHPKFNSKLKHIKKLWQYLCHAQLLIQSKLTFDRWKQVPMWITLQFNKPNAPPFSFTSFVFYISVSVWLRHFYCFAAFIVWY